MDCKVVISMRCKLMELKPGSSARVAVLTLHGPMRRRLLDLGFLPGAEVAVRFCGWGGGMSAYGIHGSMIALRRSDAEQILVDIEGSPEH